MPARWRAQNIHRGQVRAADKKSMRLLYIGCLLMQCAFDQEGDADKKAGEQKEGDNKDRDDSDALQPDAVSGTYWFIQGVGYDVLCSCCSSLRWQKAEVIQQVVSSVVELLEDVWLHFPGGY